MIIAALCVLAAALLVVAGVYMVSNSMSGCVWSFLWVMGGGVENLIAAIGQLLQYAADAVSSAGD